MQLPESQPTPTRCPTLSPFAFVPMAVTLPQTSSPLSVRGSQVRELVLQIAVRPDLVSCHLSVREHGQEPVDDIVGQCPPIVRKARRSARVIRQNVCQQLSRDAYCVL